MPYTVEFTKGAERHFDALEADVARRVLAMVGILRDNPRSPGSIKLSGEQNLYRTRAGTYRTIYEIDDRMRRVLVLKILHHREAYR
jgi:mRNA interferase RelE/StbE